MRPLLIDDAARAEIARVCKYAEENRVSNREMKNRIANPEEYCAAGDEPGHVCYLQVGFKCVMSLEEQNDRGGY